jgi:multiple sugar transport system substrate-binding protein
MKSNRRLYTIFASILILVLTAALTGCGNSSNNSGSSSNGKVTLTFSMWDTLDPNTTDFVQEFQKKNPNIKIKLVNIPNDYSQKIHSMLIGGTAPDVILSWEADVNGFAKNGAIDPLDSYIDKTKAFNMKDFIPAVSELNKSLGSTDGKVYGLPWCYATEFLYYNKDMFDKAGVSYPTADWTWADYENAAKKLTIRNGSETAQWGTDAISFPGIWYSMAGSAGDDIVKNGKIDLKDGLKKALEFQNQLTNVDKVSPQPSSGGQVSDLFSAGKAAMTRQGSWYTLGYAKNNFNWDMAPLPKDQRSYASLHTGFFTINSKSPHKAEAWKFIEFMMSKQGQTLLSKQFHNPSAEKSVMAEGAYKSTGEHGPNNWDTFEKTADAGHFGYVLFNPTVTDDLVNDFNSVLLGQKKIDDVINKDVPAAQKKLNEEK